MMRGIAIIGIVGMCLLPVTGRLGAQEARQDAGQLERGRQIAEKICWVCHVIGRDQELSPMLRSPGSDFRGDRQEARYNGRVIEGLLAHDAPDRRQALHDA